MKDHFVCGVCGETHAGLTTDWAYTLPDEVWALSDPEKATRAKYDSDLCRLDERYFVRGILPLPLIDGVGNFCWGAWAEIEPAAFFRYVELYETDGSNEPPCAGKLANDLSVYGETIGVPILVQFGDPTTRPTFTVVSDDNSLLAREQRQGIDTARHHEIVAQLSG